jgi:hypothetical protein
VIESQDKAITFFRYEFATASVVLFQCLIFTSSAIRNFPQGHYRTGFSKH